MMVARKDKLKRMSLRIVYGRESIPELKYMAAHLLIIVLMMEARQRHKTFTTLYFATARKALFCIGKLD
jgi:hypothetical protein